MISAAVRMWWATKALGEMAEVLNLSEDVLRYNKLAEEMKVKFNKEWWIENKNLWAIGLSTDPSKEKQVFLDFKTAPINYPQKYEIADLDKGRTIIENIWKSDAMDDRFSYYGSSPTVWQNSNFAVGCFNYGKGDYGLKLIKSSAACATQLKNKMMGAFSTINPDPRNDPGSNDNKIMYSWDVGPYLESIISGLMGVKANAFENLVTFMPFVPEGWSNMALRDFQTGDNVVDFIYANGKWTISHKVGSRELRIKAYINGREHDITLPIGGKLQL